MRAPVWRAGRGERGLVWQPRFFDRTLQSPKEYYDNVEYIHFNPVRAGLVKTRRGVAVAEWTRLHGGPGRNLQAESDSAHRSCTAAGR